MFLCFVRSGTWTGGDGIWVELSGKMHVLARLLAHLRQRTDDRIVLVSNYTQVSDNVLRWLMKLDVWRHISSHIWFLVVWHLTWYSTLSQQFHVIMSPAVPINNFTSYILTVVLIYFILSFNSIIYCGFNGESASCRSLSVLFYVDEIIYLRR